MDLGEDDVTEIDLNLERNRQAEQKASRRTWQESQAMKRSIRRERNFRAEGPGSSGHGNAKKREGEKGTW